MNNNTNRTPLTIDLDVNTHLVKALQGSLDCNFAVARGRFRSALRNAILDVLPEMVTRTEEDGSVSVGFVDDEGFAQGDAGVVDASLLFGAPSPHSIELED